jgi:hypothetical protein
MYNNTSLPRYERQKSDAAKFKRVLIKASILADLRIVKH